MFEFIQIILFGGNLLITPEPILVDTEPRSITIQEPLKAINCSASLNIDISEHITTRKYPDFIHEAEEKFPQGCIRISLISNDGKIAEFTKSSVTYGSPTSVSINLKAASFFDERIKYSSLIITSCRRINAAKITWYNYGNYHCNTPQVTHKE